MDNCYFRLEYGNNSRVVELPCYPDDISETLSPRWGSEEPIGRSSSIHSFYGTEDRKTSFSFDLHRDMTISIGSETSADIETILVLLRRSVYGNYTQNAINPPISTFRFGEFVIRGYVSSISFSDKKPIIDDEYALISVSVEMTQLGSPVSGELYAGFPNKHLNPYGDILVMPTEYINSYGERIK